MPPGAAEAPPQAAAGASARGLLPEAAEQALSRLAGLAPSPVLRRRLEGAAPLLAALAPLPSDAPLSLLDSPSWAALLDAVTVQETRLFRAASQITALADRLPSLPGPPRLLSAGCATGEEAWTLAVLATEAGLPAEVIGIDLCRPALAAAAAGRYGAGPPDALREVPPDYRPYFRRCGDLIEPLAPAPRFRRANLLDLPEDLGLFGAILCRNVLIYLLPGARAEVMRGLVERLLPGGLLLLGPTDAPGPELPLRPEPGASGTWRRR
ncbi:CheR family methyltransferase [Muricoccus aerilatus]|uniref:CheR family methyltransferase n=1 Tax=Muricoccus aerilatus TaxID=452982 RepID=UPI000694CCA2|nr:CheR family methyltransferase [Roseomonas aerilata]